MTTEISKYQYIHNRIDSYQGDFICSNSFFVNLYSSTNGGCIYLDHQGSKNAMKECYFIANHADVRGGAISIGHAKSLSMNRTCFDSNYADYGHDFYINTLLGIDLGMFYIEDISEVGGKSDHGSIFGVLESSTFKNSNMTKFEGGCSYIIHYSSGSILLSRLIVTDSTSTVFLKTASDVSGKITISNTVTINTCDAILELEFRTSSILIEYSTFIFKGIPTAIPSGDDITITNCTSNKELAGFTHEANPKIPSYEMIDCYGEKRKTESKCFKGICRFLVVTAGIISNKETQPELTTKSKG